MICSPTLTFAQLLCCAFILLITLTKVGTLGRFGGDRDPPTGFIIDADSEHRTKEGLLMYNGYPRAIVATNIEQMVLLGLSRVSAFSMYPCLILVFVTKLRGTGAFLARTPFNMYMCQDMHRLHAFCGWVVLLAACLHSTAHVMRWAIQGNLQLLHSHPTGITGSFLIVAVILITLPMMILKMIKYEMRKKLHYLFVWFGIAMTFHAPMSAFPNGGFCGYVFPMLLVAYFLDALYCKLWMTELIKHPTYSMDPNSNSGVLVSMSVSQRFQSWGPGGYGYVCFPWVDKNQWHAFSLFDNPVRPEERQIYVQNVGDWTRKVHELLQPDPVHSLAWLQGPFPSPYMNAIEYDNLILVAAGTGIVPAFSVIQANKGYRNINLVWAVRDPTIIRISLEYEYLSHGGKNLIFYTCPLDQSIIYNNDHCTFFNHRPNLANVIPTIMEPSQQQYQPEQCPKAPLLGERTGTWGIMYCGGNGGLLKSLKQVTSKLKRVKLHEESFNW